MKDTDLLQRFWGTEDGLDATDRFLRNYILLEGWKDKDARGKYEKSVQEKIDREDEQRDDEMEGYERAYNFRFEEPNSKFIVTH